MDQIMTFFGSFPGSEGSLLKLKGKTADGAPLGGIFQNLLNQDEEAKPGNESWLFGGKALFGGLKNDFLNRSESDELTADPIISSEQAWDLSSEESQEEKDSELSASELHPRARPGLYGFVGEADENGEAKAGLLGIAPVPAEGADCVKEQNGALSSAGTGELYLPGAVNAGGYGAGISSLEQGKDELSAGSAEGEKGLPDQEKSVGNNPALSQAGEEAVNRAAFAVARESGWEEAVSGGTQTSPASVGKSPILHEASVQVDSAGTDERPQGVTGAPSDPEQGLTAFKGAARPSEGRQGAEGNVAFNPEEIEPKGADIACKTKASLPGLGASVKESSASGVGYPFSPDVAGRFGGDTPQSSLVAPNKATPVPEPSAGDMPSEGQSSSAGSGRGLLEKELPVPAQGRVEGYSQMMSHLRAQADIPRNEGIPEAPPAVGIKDSGAYLPAHEGRTDAMEPLRAYLQTNQGGEEQEKDRAENRSDKAGSHELKELKAGDGAIRGAETMEQNAATGTRPGSKGDLFNHSALIETDLSGIHQIPDKELEASDRTDIHVSGAKTESLTDLTGRMERLSGADSPHSDGESRAETSAATIQKISSAIRHAKNNSGEIRLQLRPASLGHLQIKIACVEERSVSVRILAENPVSRELIERNIGELRSELRSNGIEMERCEVLLTGDPARDGEGGRRFAAHEPHPGNHDIDKAEKDSHETGTKRRNYGGHNDGEGLSLFA